MLPVIKSSWQSLGHDTPGPRSCLSFFFLLLLVCTHKTRLHAEPVHVRKYHAYHRKQLPALRSYNHILSLWSREKYIFIVTVTKFRSLYSATLPLIKKLSQLRTSISSSLLLMNFSPALWKIKYKNGGGMRMAFIGKDRKDGTIRDAVYRGEIWIHMQMTLTITTQIVCYRNACK